MKKPVSPYSSCPGLLLLCLVSACVELPQSSRPATTSADTQVEESQAVVEAVPPLPAPAQPEFPATPVPAVVQPQTAPEPVAVPVVEVALPAVTPPPRVEPVPPTEAPALPQPAPYQESVDELCDQIGNKLGSVSVADCLEQDFVFGGAFSINQRPLVIKEHPPRAGIDDDFRVLIMGGLHGDEYSSISVLFKWLALYSPARLEGEYYWRFAPLVNPDGLLDGQQAKRQNANGVDLNRNFPSLDWNDSAAAYWQQSTGSNPRRYPGNGPASEPEVQWVVDQIEAFRPDVIVSVHAPYHLLDFDGPAEAPEKIGELYLHQLGVYPGSLGNFAGLNRRIPVVTLELPSAGIMPPAEQIELMWQDLVLWLDRESRTGLAAQ